MWLIISSLSRHNVHRLICCVLSILTLIWPVLTSLFCAAIRKDSVSLLRFPFLCHVHVFSCKMTLVSHLKRPWDCFTSHFCFLVIVVPLVPVSLVLFLVAVIRLPARFSMSSSSRCIDVPTLSSMLVSHFPPTLLDTYCLSTSPQGCNALCMVVSFLVLWSICLSSLVHFKNGPEYLTRGTVRLFIPLTKFLL